MSATKNQKTKWELWEEMHPDKQEAIIREIEEGGFGSEIKAHEIFREFDFPSSAYYYHDLDEDKTRELDIFADSSSMPDRGRSSLICKMFAEVKSGFTWVLAGRIPDHFVAWRRPGYFAAFHPDWLNSSLDEGIFEKAEQQEIKDTLRADPLVHESTFSSVIQYTKGSDSWYDSAIRVIKACTGQIFKDDRDVLMTIPLVVLDGNLLQSYSIDGFLRLEPHDWAQVRVAYGSKAYPSKEVFINVVTMTGLPRFLKAVSGLEAKASKLLTTGYRRTRQGKAGYAWETGID